MCNIAGYVGERRAAPVLLEMLRRQQDFDGGMCAGIATIHEGRLYYRKIVGDVDALIKHTDALYLPGNIGIAHTRPGGTPSGYVLAHPFITPDETMAGVTNGTGIGNPSNRVQELAEMLEDAGVDTDSVDFVSAYGYLEGDCDEKPLIEYVKEQMQCKE